MCLHFTMHRQTYSLEKCRSPFRLLNSPENGSITGCHAACHVSFSQTQAIRQEMISTKTESGIYGADRLIYSPSQSCFIWKVRVCVGGVGVSGWYRSQMFKMATELERHLTKTMCLSYAHRWLLMQRTDKGTSAHCWCYISSDNLAL